MRVRVNELYSRWRRVYGPITSFKGVWLSHAVNVKPLIPSAPALIAMDEFGSRFLAGFLSFRSEMDLANGSGRADSCGDLVDASTPWGSRM